MKNSIFNAVCKTRYLALLVVLIFTCGNVWGALTNTYTKVTSVTDLSAGDKVVLATESSSNPSNGVTGQNSNDATVSTTESQWVQYTIALVKDGSGNVTGWTLYDPTEKKYVQSPTGNHFKYGDTGGTCSVKTTSGNGQYAFECNSRWLQENSSYYRMYTSINASYTPFYVWKVAAASSSTLTVSDNATSLAMGDAKVNGSGVTNSTLSFSGANLTANATLSISGTNAAMFSVSPTNVSKGSGTITNQTITVTYSPTSAGSHSATLTISSTGATSKTIALSGTGKYEVTWKCAGSDDVTTLVASGSRPTFPSTPTSCDTGEGASTTFYGWATNTWSGKAATLEDSKLSGITIYTSASSMPTVTGNGVVYHAVFCKGGAGSEVLNEEFDNKSSSDASNAITASTFSNFSGTTSKAYKSKYGGIKLGTGSASGYITSKSLDLSKAFTVSIDACKYGSDGSNINVTVGTTTKTISNSELGAAGTFNTYELSFDAATSTSTVKIETSSLRAYIDNVVVTRKGATSNYLTNCCTSLGSINGSICRT